MTLLQEIWDVDMLASVIITGLIFIVLVLHIATLCKLRKGSTEGAEKERRQMRGSQGAVSQVMLDPVSKTYDPSNTVIMNGIRELHTLLEATNSVLGANLQDVYKALRVQNRDLSVIVGNSSALSHLLHHRPQGGHRDLGDGLSGAAQGGAQSGPQGADRDGEGRGGAQGPAKQ